MAFVRLEDYLNPLKKQFISNPQGELGQQISFNRGALSMNGFNKGDIAILGIPYHVSHQLELLNSADLVREELKSKSISNIENLFLAYSTFY